jgi:hypothetical protein
MMDAPLTIVPATALEAVARAEIDIQVATAKQYPREVKTSVAHAIEMATATPDIAAECFYVLKRKDSRTGKVTTIEGPSIRLAEIFACTWKNLAYGFRAIADDGRAVVLEGVCVDYETNLRCTKQVRRNVLDRNGRRLSEDMVTVTTMAAGSIGCRNAIFGVIPGIYVTQALKAAKRAAVGEAKSLTARRDKAVAHFAKLGVEEARVLGVLGREAVDAITEEDVQTLLGIATAIRDGDTTLEQAFPPPPTAGQPEPAEGRTRSEALADRLAQEGARPGEAPDANDPSLAELFRKRTP